MTINELCTAAHANSRAKGFYEEEEDIINRIEDIEAPGKNSWEYHDAKRQVENIRQMMTAKRLALIHAEVSEALEADRKGRYAKVPVDRLNSNNSDSSFCSAYSDWIKGSFEEELADIIIRVADLAGWKGIDLESHVKAKMRYNSMREYKHGKQY